jgi:hypothetical protein
MTMTMRRFCNFVPIFVILAAGQVLLAQAAQTAGSDAAPAANPAPAAAATEPPSTLPAIQGLRPALDNISTVMAGLSIARWKAPGDVRSSTQQDVNSIQRDLATTLPPLLDQAQAPGALAPSFAVYRNIDALYDVLLRVTEMASLAGTPEEASHLEGVRAGLETARGQLGTLLLQSVSAQDTQVVQLRTALAAQAQVKPAEPPPSKIVVDDGPTPPKVKPKTTTTKKKPAATPPATPAAPATPQ